MQRSRLLMGVTLAGIVLFTTVPRASAMDPYTQGLLSQLLSGFVLGAPAVPSGTSPYGPYQPPGYGSYGALPPPYSPYGLSGGYSGPLPGLYGSSPYDPYQGGGYSYPYQKPHSYDYATAMQRLDRQEAAAMAKAARHSYGNPTRYNARMAKIERKYEYKRYKVARNTGYSYGYR